MSSDTPATCGAKVVSLGRPLVCNKPRGHEGQHADTRQAFGNAWTWGDPDRHAYQPSLTRRPGCCDRCGKTQAEHT